MRPIVRYPSLVSKRADKGTWLEQKPAKQKLWIACTAAALLLMAWVVSPPIGRPLAFISVFTVGMLWLLGLWRAPGLVQKARREKDSRPTRMAEPHPQVPERQFRMRIHWVGMAFIYLCGIVALVVGLGLIVGAAMHPEAWHDLLVGGLLVGMYGALMSYYGWRYSRLTVRIDPRGIDADLLFGRLQIAWDDIVIVFKRRYRIGDEYVVYSRDRAIKLPIKLENRGELVAIVLENSGQRASGGPG
jgi:hypothetical protein